jgi:hypothetical protein
MIIVKVLVTSGQHGTGGHKHKHTGTNTGAAAAKGLSKPPIDRSID